MPMNFPDSALAGTAERHRFRALRMDEHILEYRAALADHVQGIDIIESMEIRTGKGWDKWNDSEKAEMILHAMEETCHK